MAIKSSGTLALYSDIWAAGVTGGCLSNITTNISLSNAADGFGIPTNPNAMSEFYGLECPVVVDFYGTFLGDPFNESLSSWGFYYSINSGGDTLVAPANEVIVDPSIACTYFGTVKIPSSALGAGNLYYGFRQAFGKPPSPALFNATNSSTCPVDTGKFCGTEDYNNGNPYSKGVSFGNVISLSISVNVFKGNFQLC